MTSTVEGVQVTVTPTQSSYFAGETFQAIITFTNVNYQLASNIQAQPSASKPFVRSHRRATQSIAGLIPSTPSSPGSILRLPSNVTSPLSIPRPRYVIGKRKRPNVENANGLLPSTSTGIHLKNGKGKHHLRSLSAAPIQPSNITVMDLPHSAQEVYPKIKTMVAHTSCAFINISVYGQIVLS